MFEDFEKIHNSNDDRKMMLLYICFFFWARFDSYDYELFLYLYGIFCPKIGTPKFKVPNLEISQMILDFSSSMTSIFVPI